MQFDELNKAQKQQLGRVLMRDIVLTLDESDFGGVKPADVFSMQKIPHLGISADVLLDKFFAKLNGEKKQVLQDYPLIVVAAGRMLSLQECKEKEALQILERNRSKTNERKNK